MRVLLGMILGVLLAVAAAYFHDSMGGRAEASAPVASEQQTLVNWNVAEARWRDFKIGWAAVETRAREGWVTVSAYLPK